MKGDDGLFLVDTNILIYAFSEDNSTKNKLAKDLINKCWQGENNLAISAQNLAEFVFVSIKKIGLDHKEIKTIIGYITEFSGFKKINYSTTTIFLALDISYEFKMSFWDSLLAATMKENNIFNIYTENIKDFKVPWINAVNPVENKN